MILYSSPDLLTMWLVLYSIPGVMIDLVRVLQDNMGAEVFVAGESARIHVSNGLRQGCVLAPTLLLLCFNMVMHCW